MDENQYKILTDWLAAINANLTEQTKYLKNLNTAIGIIAIIIILAVVLRACGIG